MNSRHPLYNCLFQMRARCHKPDHLFYPYYGARGITVCQEWRVSYEAFRDWAFANGYAPGLEIDRIDNNSGYRPDNCRWVTHKVNLNNTRATRRLTAFGETKTFTDWLSDPRCVVSHKTSVRGRLDLGWSVEEALATPVNPIRKSPYAVAAFGETKTLEEWVRDPRCSVRWAALRWRLEAGWPAEKAITNGRYVWSGPKKRAVSVASGGPQ